LPEDIKEKFEPFLQWSWGI